MERRWINKVLFSATTSIHHRLYTPISKFNLAVNIYSFSVGNFHADVILPSTGNSIFNAQFFNYHCPLVNNG